MGNSTTFVFWDVEHGHATYIKTPNGKHIVIDLGIGSYKRKSEVFSPLLHLKDKYGVQQLDYVIITHPHLDHIDDMLNFQALNPKVLMRPRQLKREDIITEEIKTHHKAIFEKYLEIDSLYTLGVDSDCKTDNPDNFGGLKIRSFSPIICPKDNFNNHSIVTVMEYAGLKVVLPGDNEPASIKELRLTPGFDDAVRNADVLLAPHHGRQSGWDSEWVDLVNPRVTIVSDGRFCDTSANGRYSAKSRGWRVYYRNGTDEERKCLTTNSDGVIKVEIGFNNDGKNFLSIRAR